MPQPLGMGLTRDSPGEAGVEVGSVLVWRFPHLPRTLCISSALVEMDLGWSQGSQGEVAFVSPIHHHVPVLLCSCSGELFIASLSWMQRRQALDLCGQGQVAVLYQPHHC